MASKYLSCAETAAMVRQALKEAFPGVKFSIRSKTYSGGASIGVRWIDGPNSDQVEAITKVFQGAYFDGSIDYKGRIHHMIDGQEIAFGADCINTYRDYTDATIERAIGRVVRQYAANLRDAGMPAPTVEDFKHGRCLNVQLPGVHCFGNESLQADIRRVLSRHSDRLQVGQSKTAGKVMILGDDGYSRQCGSGFSAADIVD